MQRVLVMGLPGAGKTTLSVQLKQFLEANNKSVEWLNADEIRTQFNDWDFSIKGRLRQSLRMKLLSDQSQADFCFVDMVAPLVEMRTTLQPDWLVWMDTIQSGRFEDTNAMFNPPSQYDFRICEQNAEKWAEFIGQHLVNNQRRPVFDWRKETVQMMGRWQPWHAGHRALFERLISRTGQVVIQIRDVQGWQNNNPFDYNQVESFIKRDLDPLFQGQFHVMLVPNITHIGWGRGVGYTSGEELFDESITSISATNIRKEMGL